MKSPRTLTLRKETLVELTSGELAEIVGGASDCVCVPPTLTMCPDYYCTGTV